MPSTNRLGNKIGHADIEALSDYVRQGFYIIGHGLDNTKVEEIRKQGWPLLKPNQAIEWIIDQNSVVNFQSKD